MTSVVVGYLHSTNVSHSFVDSLWRVKEKHPNLKRIAISCGPMSIPMGRNKIMAMFMVSEFEWLWMLDTDMGFAPDTLDRLLETAEKHGYPVVGAHCVGEFSGRPDGLGGFDRLHAGTLYEKDPERPGHYSLLPEYPEDTVMEVDATGAACLLVHRSAVQDWDGWFDPFPRMGEDISFCRRLTEHGHKIAVHSGIKTSHQKVMYLK